MDEATPPLLPQFLSGICAFYEWSRGKDSGGGGGGIVRGAELRQMQFDRSLPVLEAVGSLSLRMKKGSRMQGMLS